MPNFVLMHFLKLLFPTGWDVPDMVVTGLLSTNGNAVNA